jgi:hypothetical protein
MTFADSEQPYKLTDATIEFKSEATAHELVDSVKDFEDSILKGVTRTARVRWAANFSSHRVPQSPPPQPVSKTSKLRKKRKRKAVQKARKANRRRR